MPDQKVPDKPKTTAKILTVSARKSDCVWLANDDFPKQAPILPIGASFFVEIGIVFIAARGKKVFSRAGKSFMLSLAINWLFKGANFQMEMVYGGMASMFLGWWVGRIMKLSEVDSLVAITMAGGGSLLSGLAYLWIADITIGQSGSLIWLLVGVIGGAAGIVAYIFTRYADWLVDLCKRNGLL